MNRFRLPLFLALLALLGACASRSPDGSNCLDDNTCDEPSPTTYEEPEDQAWYCYGAEGDQPWNCVGERDDSKIRESVVPPPPGFEEPSVGREPSAQEEPSPVEEAASAVLEAEPAVPEVAPAAAGEKPAAASVEPPVQLDDEELPPVEEAVSAAPA
ncbi:MAG: hypothetical protein ACR2PJ_06010, partial [Pseudomonadales bacterium]